VDPTKNPFWRERAPLVLASKSAGRRLVLEQAGLPFVAVPADVDERVIEGAVLASGGDADAVVTALACAKAKVLSAVRPGALVLGADQAASCESRLFGKPSDRAVAAQQLRFLSGKTHRLHSGFALARDGAVVAQGVGHADLLMRAFSDAFLEAYLDAMGEDVTTSAGAYKIEGFGALLFERVAGDHWTILGLPLMDVLAALRRIGAVAE